MLPYLLGLYGVILAAFFLIYAFDPTFRSKPNVVFIIKLTTYIPIVAAGALALIAIHELGHVLAGRLVGWRCHLLLVGPFAFTRPAGRLTLRLNFRALMLMGMAVCVPEGREHLARRLAVMVAGGPTASLLIGALALFVTLHVVGLPDSDGVSLTATKVLSLTLSAGLFHGIAVLIPEELLGHPTDGKILWILLFDRQRAERFARVLALRAAWRSGISPRDWESSLLMTEESTVSPTVEFADHALLTYYHCVAANDIERAGLNIDRAVQASVGVAAHAQDLILLEAALFEAMARGNAQRARELFTRAGSGLNIPSHSRPLVESAVLLTEGQYDGAIGRAEEALRKAAVLPESERATVAGVLDKIISAAQLRKGGTATLPETPTPN